MTIGFYFFQTFKASYFGELFLPPKTFLTIQSCKGTKCQCIILLASLTCAQTGFSKIALKLVALLFKRGICSRNLSRKPILESSIGLKHIPLGFRAVLISQVTLAKVQFYFALQKQIQTHFFFIKCTDVALYVGRSKIDIDHPNFIVTHEVVFFLL